jgi:hypothetical protein
MSRLRGQLAMQDLADLAAYLAAPAVPSPLVRLTTCGPAANRYTPERLEFRAASSVPSEIRVRNGGELPLRLLSAPVIAGEAAGAFSITRSDCEAGTVLAPNASCSVAIASGRATAGRARSARVSVAHDWIGGRATVALLLDTAAARSAGRPCD